MSEESTNAADVRVGEPVVRIEGLRKSFGDNVVLRGIDLEVQRGEVVVILGPSGSGKSTLLRCVNLLETPTDGRIFFEDTEITAKKTDINKVRAKVGMVFQNFNLFPHLTAKKNVMLAQQKVLHRAKEEAEKVAVEQLTRVGLADRVDYKPSELSGGQQRRVAFAGVLAMEPRVLVLDEPVAGLDPVAREEFLDLIAQLHAGGLTVVMVSHSMDDLARLSDRVLVLNEGRQFAFGSPAEVFAHGDELRAIGLDVPAPQKLASELREAGVNLPRDLYDVETLANDLAAAFNSQAETDTGKGGSVRSGEAKAAQLLSEAAPDGTARPAGGRSERHHA